jgi:SpoIVB peptidase S55
VRSYSWQIGAVIAGLVVGLGANVPLASGQPGAKLPTIDVNDIKDGMKGYGLTVFKGTEPEKFDVEVVGILHDFRPGQSLILMKTPHPLLNNAKIVRGMSGSPIFLNGKLAGAYSYGWNFMTDPIAGATPIAPMLTEMYRPIAPGFWPLEKGASPISTKPVAAPPPQRHATLEQYDGAPGTYDIEAHSAQLAKRIGRPVDPSRPSVRASTPLMLGGVGDHTFEFLKKIFEPLGIEPMQSGTGSGSTDGAPAHFTNGGALGVALARGDVSFMGLGTATYTDGVKVAGFGHPMMEGGDSALPACVGRVVWLMSSSQSSWKMGECARPLGTLIQDRQSAIVVDESRTPPTFPVDVKINGLDRSAPKTTWHDDVSEDMFSSAAIVASVIGSTIEATVSEKRDLTWHMTSTLVVRGEKTQRTLTLDDFGVAIGGTPDAGDLFRTRIVRALGDAMNNPWENVHIDKVESTLSFTYTRDVWHLRGVELLDPVVDAGEKARIRLHLLPDYGPMIERVVEVKLPKELEGKEVDIDIAAGFDILPEMSAPESLGALLDNETRETPPRTIVLQFRVPGQGVTFDGHVVGRLPAFALDAVRATSSDSVPDPYVPYSRTIIPVEKYLDGRDKVRVKVRAVER